MKIDIRWDVIVSHFPGAATVTVPIFATQSDSRFNAPAGATIYV